MVDKEYYADCVAAHKYCSNHKSQLMKDKKCGCFYCTEIFSPNEITEWIKDTSGTAICPYCGIDSIIGESSGYAVVVEALHTVEFFVLQLASEAASASSEIDVIKMHNFRFNIRTHGLRAL